MVDKQEIKELEYNFREKEKFELFRRISPGEILTIIPLVLLEYSTIWGDITDVREMTELLLKECKVSEQFIARMKRDVAERNVERVSGMIKAPDSYAAFELLGEKLYESAKETYQGHPLYEVLGAKIGCDFKVIQMMSPNDIADFGTGENLVVYVLEVEGFFVMLYPKPEFYKKVWVSEEEPEIVTEGFKPCKGEIRSKTQGENQLNKGSCRILVEGLTRHRDRIDAFITELRESREGLVDKLGQTLENAKLDMVKYKGELDDCIGKIRGNEIPSDEIGELMKMTPKDAKIYANGMKSIEFSINQSVIEQTVIIGQLLDLKIKETARKEHKNEVHEEEKRESCHVCREVGEMLDSQCQCKVCVKCIEKDKQQALNSCLNCYKTLNHIGRVRIRSFLEDRKNATISKYKDNMKLCMKCGNEPDADLMTQLGCSCRLCFSCIAESYNTCPICRELHSYEDKDKIRQMLYSASFVDTCKSCNEKKAFVCNCSCWDCAWEIAGNYPHKCKRCNSEYTNEFQHELLIRGKRCGKCKEGKIYSDLTRLPCSCEVCVSCIGINKRTIIENCIVCGGVYTASYERETVKRLVDQLYPEIDEARCTKCGTKDNLVCKCLCTRCTSHTNTLCSRCKVFRQRPYEANKYSSSQVDFQRAVECKICHQRHKYIPEVCLTCKVCIDCLRTGFDKNYCPACRTQYTTHEKDRYNKVAF